MKNKFIVITFILLLVSCGTIGKVTERQQNGKFQATKEAQTLISLPFDIDIHKTLLVVPNDNFMLGMAGNLNYFEKVMTFENFELEIITSEKQDEVGSLSGKIGLNNAYRKFKPFLYIQLDRNDEKPNYLQLKLIDPNKAEEIFVNEIYLDYVWAGVNDRNAFNPLFNGLIEYIETNSKTYNK